MKATNYLPEVSWTTTVENVILVSQENESNPAVYRIDVNPIDINEPGAIEAIKEVGFYLKDYLGHIYTIVAVGEATIDVSDDFRTGYGPQSGRIGIVYKSVGDGRTKYLAPIRHTQLNTTARDYSDAIDLAYLWENINITNVKWHPEELTFMCDSDDIFSFSSGKIFIHNWYKAEEVQFLNTDNSYLTGADPSPLFRSWNVTEGNVTLTEECSYYIIAKLPTSEPNNQAEIILSKHYYREVVQEDYLHILIGVLHPSRSMSLLWGDLQSNIYEAFASDQLGTNFSLVSLDDLDYRAIIISYKKSTLLTALDFQGKWYQYKFRVDKSITGTGTINDKITLVNDEEDPGSNKYYGTDLSGEKGYHEFNIPQNHNDLQNLNQGDYQHLTELEKSQIFHANREALDDVSGINTGDETQQTIKDKLGPADTDSDGYLKYEDWNIFYGRQPKIQIGPRYSGSHAGYAGEVWIDDDYMYICVFPGDAGTARWKKIILLSN